MSDFDIDADHDEPLPRDPDTIEMAELDQALRGLTMLGDDPFLRTQATHIALIDKWLMPFETQAMLWLSQDEGIDIEAAMFLNAQSQMWLFSLYELLRTWKERVKDVQTLVKNSGLTVKIASLEEDQGFNHVNRLSLASQLRRIEKDESIASNIADDLARTHVLYGQLEFLRVALAKHQVSGKGKQLAYAPGYARIDRWTGSLEYQLSNGIAILGNATRRNFADGLRYILEDRTVPNKRDLDTFDRFLNISPKDVSSMFKKQ